MAVHVSRGSRCGFCVEGRHSKCTVGTKHRGPHEKFKQGVVWACACECNEGRRKCADCNNRNTDEVNPETWTCIDAEACQALVAERRATNPVLIQLRDIKERTMAKIENDKAKAKATAKPKTGTCVCGCKGETKGGKFLPGHDARFVSGLVGEVAGANFTGKSEQAARKSLKDAGASDKLVAKFDKSLGLAKDKAEKKAAAAKEKADAKASA